MVNNKGEFAIRTPTIAKSEKYQADSSVYINKGKMKLDNETENRFREAIDKSVAANMARIKQELTM